MGTRQHARFKSVLPVRIWWSESNGARHSHLTHTLDIGQYGVRLGGVREPITVSDVITLQYKQRRAEFKVVWVGPPGTPLRYQVGLSALEPEKNIWGELPVEQAFADEYVIPGAARASAAQVPPRPAPEPPPAAPPVLVEDKVKTEITRRLKVATEELCDIDELIKAGDVDPAVLNEFRESLTLVRRTAWGIQKWFELRQRGDQQFPLLTFLMEERLAVATRLCHQLARDVAELSVKVEPASMVALVEAVEELANQLQFYPGASSVSGKSDAERALQQTVPQIEMPPSPAEQPAPEVALGALVQRALARTGADGVAIALSDGAEMVCHASAGIAPEPGLRWDTASGLSGEALRTGEPVRCDDTESDARVDPVLCRAANLRSCLIVPILIGGVAKGTLEAYSSLAGAFSADHMQFLTDAAKSVVAILTG